MVAIDPFGNYFKMLIIVTSVLVVFFSISSDEIKKITDRTGEYYALIFGMILGMFFMISASDLILIYLSLELLSLSSYVLAGFTKLRDRNSEASLKYLIYGAVSSGLMLFGISVGLRNDRKHQSLCYQFSNTGSANKFTNNRHLQ